MSYPNNTDAQPAPCHGLTAAQCAKPNSIPTEFVRAQVDRMVADTVSYSSVVGSSIALRDPQGRVVCLLRVMVPDPAYNYQEVSDVVTPEIVRRFNAGAAVVAAKDDPAV